MSNINYIKFLMKSFHNIHGLVILYEKEKKEAGVICFEVRIPKKIRNNHYGIIPSKIDVNDVRH